MIPVWIIEAGLAAVCFFGASSVKGFTKGVLWLFAAMLGFAALMSAAADWRFWLIVVAFVAGKLLLEQRKRAQKRRKREQRHDGGTHYHTTHNYYNRP